MGVRSGVEVAGVEPELRFDEQESGWIKVALNLADKDISQASIIPMTMRYGVATVRMDGIGGVATEEAYRNRGHSRRVMEAAVGRMREGPAAVTTLYGIPHFYPKYGYATLGPESSIQLRDLEATGSSGEGWSARQAEPGDLPAIHAIYERSSAGATGALVRPPDGTAWKRLRESVERADGECRVVVDDDEEVAAYAWQATGCWWMNHWERWSPGGLKLAEAFARSPRAADALLAACGTWARELGHDRVELGIPPDGPVAMAAMLRGCLTCQQFTRDGEFMGRVVGLEALLRSIQPELARVWAASGTRFRGQLDVDTGEECVGIALTDEGVAVVDGTSAKESSPTTSLTASLAPGELARLVFGGMLPAEQLARVPGVDGAVAEVLTALFPRRFPYIYPADRF